MIGREGFARGAGRTVAMLPNTRALCWALGGWTALAEGENCDAERAAGSWGFIAAGF